MFLSAWNEQKTLGRESKTKNTDGSYGFTPSWTWLISKLLPSDQKQH